MVIARDTVAADQLVYAWPFPIGPEPIEVTCTEEEVVVMCPAWVVSERLGPGRHRWRTPDPSRPTNAYFVLTGPVEASFDMLTTFVVPSTQQPVRLRAQGSLLVRCIDPALLIGQFVGLPFDNINDGLMRSVGASVERLLARVLVRRVLAGGTTVAVTDPQMLPSIIDEATAYNPTAGAVHGVMFVRFNQLLVQADDGGMGGGMWSAQQGWGETSDPGVHQPQHFEGQVPDNYTAGQPYPTGGFAAQPYATGAFGMSGATEAQSYPTGGFAVGSQPPAAPSFAATGAPVPIANVVSAKENAVASGEIGGKRNASAAAAPAPAPAPAEPIMLGAGARVLVSSEDGLLHSAMVKQHSQGYYEVEIGATGETVWVPAGQVIPEG